MIVGGRRTRGVQIRVILTFHVGGRRITVGYILFFFLGNFFLVRA